MTRHMRSKAIQCQKCGGRSYVVADLDHGTIESIDLAVACKYPAVCPNEFVEGVFDRQFGARVIIPKMGGPK